MSDNNQRRKAAMQSLEKEIKSRDRAEKMKPLGVVTAAAVAIVVIVGGIIFATKYTGNEHKQDQAASQSTSTAAQGSRPRRSRYGNQHPNHYEKFAKRDDQRF